jgi:hypothetical protein
MTMLRNQRIQSDILEMLAQTSKPIAPRPVIIEWCRRMMLQGESRGETYATFESGARVEHRGQCVAFRVTKTATTS